jgi:putative nucleotidyltransferase with HDIG domain
MIVNANIERIVAKIGDLPAMPEIVREVMEVTGDPNVAVSEVSALIEKDPALTAKLLKVSNSSYYGMRQVVGTLKLALVILGVKEVRNIVLGVSVLETLTSPSTENLLNKQGLWDHSVEVASLSKKLGSFFELSLQGEDFIAGLLHDIGKMVLWNQMGEEYHLLYNSASKSDRTLAEMELEKYDFDHADVAYGLANSWALPNSLSGAIWAHHPAEGKSLSDTTDPKLSALVQIANLASHDDWGEPDSQEEGAVDYEAFGSCTIENAWKVLLEGQESINIEGRHAILKEFVYEVNHSPAMKF